VVVSVLWDIDNTLMRAPGVGVRAFAEALVLVTGREIPRQPYDFGGKTDPLIAAELLRAVGIDDDDLVPAMLAQVERSYEAMGDELERRAVRLAGAHELVTELTTRGARQTVVTGNIEPVARRKLRAIGLDELIDLGAGAYGSDHVDRRELARLAVERLGSSGPVDPTRIWVIGDTPRDAWCAAAIGAHCILVATGTFPIDALRECAAAAVLVDLADVEAVLGLLDPAPLPAGDAGARPSH
jgi:phosphoglycolate phosphatase-like HAD superfamily hydrolase